MLEYGSSIMYYPLRHETNVNKEVYMIFIFVLVSLGLLPSLLRRSGKEYSVSLVCLAFRVCSVFRPISL